MFLSFQYQINFRFKALLAFSWKVHVMNSYEAFFLVSSLGMCSKDVRHGFDMTKQEIYRIPLLDATLSSHLMNRLLLKRIRIDDLLSAAVWEWRNVFQHSGTQRAICHDCFNVIVTLTLSAHLSLLLVSLAFFHRSQIWPPFVFAERGGASSYQSPGTFTLSRIIPVAYFRLVSIWWTTLDGCRPRLMF